MQEIYYLNHDQFVKGDTKKAFDFALSLIKKYKDVDTITFLVCPQSNYEGFLGEMNFSKDQYEKNFFVCNGIRFQIHTTKTYNPSRIIKDNPNFELLIALGVSSRQLEQFVDKDRVKYWIIVPWLMQENVSFLKIHNAIDMETNKQFSNIPKIDSRLKGAINWLIYTSNPNEGYNHPNDIERLKNMANAIAYYKILFSHNELVNYCLNHGMNNEAALKTVEYFEKARIRKFVVKDSYSQEFLLEQMNQAEKK